MTAADRLAAIEARSIPVAFHKLSREQLLILSIALQDQRDNARAMSRDQQAVIERVREMHHRECGDYRDGFGQVWTGDHCIHCRDEWPCPTIAALTATEGAK
jgi:hypothetical protein